MNVNEFQLDAFCGGSPLRFLDLGNGLNVAFVRTTTGISELLHVIPGSLFGDETFFSGSSRQILAPTLRTSVVVQTDEGAFRARRLWDSPGSPLQVSSKDDLDLDVHQGTAILQRISSAVYRQTFTFDLDHLERLAHDPGRARKWFHQVTAALSRDARTNHEGEDPPDGGSTRLVASSRKEAGLETPVQALAVRVAELQKLIADRAAQSELGRGAPPLRGGLDRDRLNADLLQLEKLASESQAAWQQHAAEQEQWLACVMLHRLRSQIAELDRKISAPVSRKSENRESPSATQSSIDRIADRLTQAKEELSQLSQERKELKDQITELRKQEKAPQLLPQAEALLVQEKPLLKEEDALEQLRGRIEDVQARVSAERFQPSVRPAVETRVPKADATTLTRLEQLWDRVRETERDRDAAEQRRTQLESQPIATPALRLTPSSSSTDAVAIHEAEARVARLQDQLGWKGERASLDRKRQDLELQVKELYRQQLLPFGTILLFGVPFVIGTAMVIHALLSRGPQQQPYWPQVLWGFVIAGLAALIKILRDREQSELLLTARGRLARVRDLLSQGAGAESTEDLVVEAQLRAAERELNDLRTRFAEDAAYEASSTSPSSGVDPAALERARRDATAAKERYRDAQQQWRQLLQELEVPISSNLSIAREMLAERARTTVRESAEPMPDASLSWQLQGMQSDFERRQSWLAQQVDLWQQLAREFGYNATTGSIRDYAEVLKEAIRDSRERDQARRQILRSLTRIKQKEVAVRENARRLAAQQRELTAQLQARRNEQRQQRHVAEELRKSLQAQRVELIQELDRWSARFNLQARGDTSRWTEEEIESRLAEARDATERAREQWIEQLEGQGRLRGQLAVMESAPAAVEPTPVSWTPLQDKVVELDREVQSAISAIRGSEALQPRQASPARDSVYLDAASRYLRELSGLALSRISFRPGRRFANVQTRDGGWTSIQNMRPEHFANVYMALWMAQIEQQADRGVRYPIVMQDPLNITTGNRKSAVAGLLREFAARGHQTLLVASNENHARLFARLGVPIADLSNRESHGEGDADVVAADWENVGGNGLTRSTSEPIAAEPSRRVSRWD